MTPAEQLAQALTPEAIEQLVSVLARVDHPGTTKAEFHHGADGTVTDVEIVPPVRRIKIRRR
jgi:hypothetical protein